MEFKKSLESGDCDQKSYQTPEIDPDTVNAFDPDLEDAQYIDDTDSENEEYIEAIGEGILPTFLVRCPSVVSVLENREPITRSQLSSRSWSSSSELSSSSSVQYENGKENINVQPAGKLSDDTNGGYSVDSSYEDSITSTSSQQGLLAHEARNIASHEKIDIMSILSECSEPPKSPERTLKGLTVEPLDAQMSISRFSIEKVPEPVSPILPVSKENDRHVTFSSENNIDFIISSNSLHDQSEKEKSDDGMIGNEDSVQSTSSQQGLLARAARWMLGRTASFEDDLPSYNEDSVQSTSSQQGLLARAARRIAYGAANKKQEKPREAKKYLKNLYIISISFTFIFMSTNTLRNLQSSLNHKGGLGLISLSFMYGAFVLTCTMATAITQRLRPKWTLVLAMCGHVVYAASNFYSSYYTLVPASAIAGISNALLWTAHGTYIASIASSYAAVMKKPVQNVMNKFYGTFFMIWQMSNIFGNLVASVVLSMPFDDDSKKMPASQEIFAFNNSSEKLPSNTAMPLILTMNDTVYNTIQEIQNGHENNFLHNVSSGIQSNSTVIDHSHLSVCGANYCQSYQIVHEGEHISQKLVYILIGVFLALTITGLLIVIFFLDRLRKIFQRNPSSTRKQLLAMFSILKNRKKQLLLVPYLYTGIRVTLVFGEYTKAFVTCPLGMNMIGYVMICFGAFSAFSATITGRLAKHVSRRILLCFGWSVEVVIVVVLFTWHPTPEQKYVLFIIAGLWGMTDGIFATQLSTLVGTLFPKKKESAFASMKFFQALGVAIGFGYAPHFCMQLKTCLYSTIMVLAFTSYQVLEWYLKKYGTDDDVKESPAEKPKLLKVESDLSEQGMGDSRSLKN